MSRLMKHCTLAAVTAGMLLTASAASATPAAMALSAPVEVASFGATLVGHPHSGGRIIGHRGYRRGYGGLYFAPAYVGPTGCGWLRARWHETGSRYWYRRYRACVEGW